MLSIRPATPADVPLILEFIRDLAEYEREPQAAVARPEDLLRDGFGPEPKFRCVLADWDNEPAGFAFYFFNYSTWQGRPGLYLEDLFVRPKYRGFGIGKALLIYLAKVAIAENCGRFQWQVLDWNEPAIKFYESLGAKEMTEWLTMRMEGEALRKLAEQSSVASSQSAAALSGQPSAAAGHPTFPCHSERSEESAVCPHPEKADSSLRSE